MQSGDAPYRRKPRASTTRSLREEGVEDARYIFFLDAATVIGNLDYCFSAGFFVGYVFSTPDRDSDLAVIFDGLDGVDNEIEHRVFELRRITPKYDVACGRFKFEAYSVVP